MNDAKASSDWTYQGSPITIAPEEFESFVYLITNLLNGRRYIGKKTLFSRTTLPPLKSAKSTKKRKLVKESDWKKYFGSSAELQGDVALHGEDNFTREILHWCKTRSDASYLEIREQLIRDVLLSDDYYNSWITCKISGSHLKNLQK